KEAKQRPENNREYEQCREQRQGNSHARRNARALPEQNHLARPVGDPGDAERKRGDGKQKENNADHCCLRSAMATSAALIRFLISFSASRRRSAASSQSFAVSFACGGSALASSSAPARSPRASFVSMRATMAPGSLPFGSPVGRTSINRLALSQSRMNTPVSC